MAGHLLSNDGTALQTPSLCSLSPTPPHPIMFTKGLGRW